MTPSSAAAETRVWRIGFSSLRNSRAAPAAFWVRGDWQAARGRASGSRRGERSIGLVSDDEARAGDEQQGEHELAKSALVQPAVEPEPGPGAGEHRRQAD